MMRKIIIFLFFVFVAEAVAAQQTEGTRWYDLSFAEALREAAKQKKMLFVDCYTKTCRPCKFMKDRVFPLKEVGGYLNADFVCVMKDMEEGDGKEIAGKYNVKIYPTFLVLDAEGNEIFRMLMQLSPEKEFLPTLKLNRKIVEERKKFDAGERGREFLSGYFRDLKQLNRVDYEKALGDYMYNEKRDSMNSRVWWNLFKTEIHRIELPLFRYVLANRKQLAQTFGRQEVYDKLYKEYAEEFRIARKMKLDYDLRIDDMKMLASDGIEGADVLELRMESYRLWNLGRGGNGDVMAYLERLDKMLAGKKEMTLLMGIAEDLGTLCEVAAPAERRKMAKILQDIEKQAKQEHHISRLGQLKSYMVNE